MRISVFAGVCFFAYKLIFHLNYHNAAAWLAGSFTLNNFIKLIVCCTVDWAEPLWYLAATLETYIFWYLIVRVNAADKVVKLTPLLFAVQIAWTLICNAESFPWFWKINFIIKALPWFLVGYYIHSFPKEKLKKISGKCIATLVLSGFVIVCASAFFRPSYDFSVIGAVPYALGLFILAVKNPDLSVCKAVEFTAQKLSLNIYVFHVLVAGALNFILGIIFHHPVENAVYLWLRPVIVLLLTALLSFVLYKLKTLLGAKKKLKCYIRSN